ncbi:multicopper oxidase domain-containing protein, partial [Actinoplanes sp. NPDC051633]|uniref:multicopper oxidase domain-containing protein n=1 Tax=Actinoplanes sp. NPDC051633 TaxID=3155670 RepID=UPI003416A888
DSGRVEQEEFVDAVTLAPSERAVVDVRFETTGPVLLQHRTPNRTYDIAAVAVGDRPVHPAAGAAFESLRRNEDLHAERARIAAYVDAAPDRTLRFLAEMTAAQAKPGQHYSCPMHPHVVSSEPGHCPECGMALLPQDVPVGHHGETGHEHPGSAAHGIEWEDDMVEVNRGTTPATMRWKIIDAATDAENAAIDWRFRVGDQVKIRLLNEMAGDHPMHHPFHIHGAGRFLILSRDGVPEPNLVWKDTVLTRAGETVDILLDVTNPGRWMAHCHIAEHHEAGMMFSFDVQP